MSTPKSIVAIFYLLLFAIVSCQKEDLTASTDDIDTVEDFLKMSTAATSTVCAKDSADSLHHKRHFNITQIDVAAIPAVITAYIQTNYAGAIIDKAGTDSLGNYYIKIVKADSTHLGLLFDASGNFVKELLHRANKQRGTIIDASALPATATAYIAANYATATIHKAILEADGTYKVILLQTDNTYLGLSFDASGNFISTIAVKDKNGKRKGKKR